MRLDKLLVHMGYGSRKDVKQLLKKKIVSVDDVICTKGDHQVNPETQVICAKGKKVQYISDVYLMLHKPPGVISATEDTMHQTVLDFVPAALQHMHLFPVGRLDKDTEGLLFLTNDGQMNHRITSPKHDVPKTYYAHIAGEVEAFHVDQFKEGLTLEDGYRTKPSELSIIQSSDITKIELVITEGKFHQVKRMFEAIGKKVIYLKRTAIGEITLDDSLKLGETRKLTAEEIQYLKQL